MRQDMDKNKNNQQDRYEVEYCDYNTHEWESVSAKTLKEAKEYYSMLKMYKDCRFKTLYDRVSGAIIKQEG